MMHRRSQVPSAGKVAASLAAVSVLVSVFVVAGAHSAGEPAGRIAFTRPDGIYAMRADGSGIRPLQRGVGATQAADLAWSPDGRKLAFTSSSGVFVMNADGSHLLRLFSAEDAPRWPFIPSVTWLPDSRAVAFTATVTGIRDIWLATTDGGKLRRLAKTLDRSEWEVAWSPTGGRIAFTEMTAGWTLQLYVQATNRSKPRLLSVPFVPMLWWLVPPRPRLPAPSDGMPAWSPDGHKVAFVRWRGERDAEIWVVRRDGRSRLQLTRNHRADSDPSWSPDGTKIAFVRGGSGERDCVYCSPTRHSPAEIYVMNADGTGVKRLTHNRVGEGSPAWQPVASS